MKEFQTLELNLIALDEQDVITTSGEKTFATDGFYDGDGEWL